MVKTIEEDEDDASDDDVKAWNNERRPNKLANSLTTIEQLRPHDFRSHDMRPRTLNLTTCNLEQSISRLATPRTIDLRFSLINKDGKFSCCDNDFELTTSD
ncbi:hypothetical protein DY000_02051566 [Brassica cretica]|uniref:Uncharacterized protein n=1 Tax=Brassica cretica TaxID=69181 RepID=A0ABQ7EYE9_BRACR|nr:hypothetical protein DY000_02051566 [Brassica cretica]